jgi:Stress responsive A/B Barrel Domain
MEKRMKQRLIGLAVAALLSGCALAPQSSESGALHQVSVIWLKNHGDAAARQAYIDAGSAVAKLPGVLAYHIGRQQSVPRARPNAAVDQSFDLVVEARFADTAALQQFLNNAEYVRIAQTALRPLVERYQVYEFVD